MKSQLVNEAEAAALFRVSPATLARARRRGLLPHVRVGGRKIFYDLEELRAAVARPASCAPAPYAPASA